jgi:hypothetical protein
LKGIARERARPRARTVDVERVVQSHRPLDVCGIIRLLVLLRQVVETDDRRTAGTSASSRESP